MEETRSEKFSEWADRFEARSEAPFERDHPKWLIGVAKQYHRLAAKKEKAFEHKQEQRRQKGKRH